jgi:hypothetical protein
MPKPAYEHRVKVALFGDGSINFILDDTEGKKSIRINLATLTSCALSLQRVIRIATETNKLPDDGDSDILEKSHLGVEFISGMCACLASTLERMGDGDVEE